MKLSTYKTKTLHLINNFNLSIYQVGFHSHRGAARQYGNIHPYMHSLTSLPLGEEGPILILARWAGSSVQYRQDHSASGLDSRRWCTPATSQQI